MSDRFGANLVTGVDRNCEFTDARIAALLSKGGNASNPQNCGR